MGTDKRIHVNFRYFPEKYQKISEHCYQEAVESQVLLVSTGRLKKLTAGFVQ
jgi:hypothetical protein